MSLEDRVALVTGGGTGIGRGVSEALAREGVKVAVNYSQSKEGAEEVVRHIVAAGGVAEPIQASVARESDVLRMIGQIEREFGRLDLVVNNAGWSTRIPHERLEDLTDEIWDRTLNTNLRGAFYCSRAALPLLRKQTGSSIVNIASVAGITGMGSSIVYAASKAAMLSMTRSLARALAPEEGEAQSPLERLATPEDIAEAVIYLAKSPAVTGETILVDGGTTTLGPRYRKHV
jgi:3-oxoacyl-[acyl-carrier protein] reductase